MRRASVVAALAVSALGGTLATDARSDGDPASDYLVGNRVFLSSQSSSVSSSQRRLLSAVQAANRAGFAIRVAVVPSDYDLGSITALWRRPRLYARFLGLELSAAYKQRLLVVMPNGFGFNWPGHATEAAYRTLAAIPVEPGGSGLTGAAQAAVQRLAGADGITLTPVAHTQAGATAGTARGGGRSVVIFALLLACVVGLALLLAQRRRRRVQVVDVPDPVIADRSGSRIRLGWAVPGLAVVFGVAVAAPLIALNTFRHVSNAPEVLSGSVVTPPPFSWPAGRRPAPQFVLRDQDGRRVSLAAYRGRPVIVTFVDPLCRNLCPLEAKLLNDIVGRMPAAQRPAILAVRVDVYANARANLLQDVRKWELVPQWHWAVGSAVQLAAVWNRYRVGVAVTTKKISGTTINYITHTEAVVCVLDATGHERALFLWPFYPQDVEHVLQRLT